MVTKEEFEKVIDQLRQGTIDSYRVEKDHLLLFRKVIGDQQDMSDFRGYAKHKGDTVFTYEPGWIENNQ